MCHRTDMGKVTKCQEQQGLGGFFIPSSKQPHKVGDITSPLRVRSLLPGRAGAEALGLGLPGHGLQKLQI